MDRPPTAESNLSDKKRARLSRRTPYLQTRRNASYQLQFSEKGYTIPFPPFFIVYHWRYAAAYTAPSCGSGLGISHPAGHAGTLTPATAHRAGASHLSNTRIRSLESRIPWCRRAGKLDARHTGRGSPPPRGRILLKAYVKRRRCLSPNVTRLCPEPSVPRLTDAGGRIIVSKHACVGFYCSTHQLCVGETCTTGVTRIHTPRFRISADLVPLVRRGMPEE